MTVQFLFVACMVCQSCCLMGGFRVRNVPICARRISSALLIILDSWTSKLLLGPCMTGSSFTTLMLRVGLAATKYKQAKK